MSNRCQAINFNNNKSISKIRVVMIKESIIKKVLIQGSVKKIWRKFKPKIERVFNLI